MSQKNKKGIVPVVWLINIAIVFEILFMISPFALYYYSTYGPSLNFLHNWPQTAWLTSFFLPHFTETSSALINSLNGFGRILFLGGLALFVIGAGQIYYAKFSKAGAVTDGLYKRIRHPQYTAFAIMGLGVMLVWPRFTVLIVYVVMLFVYYFLARYEEKVCSEKYGEPYKAYLENTNMFLPGRYHRQARFTARTQSPHGGIALYGLLFVTTLLVFVASAFGLRNYSIAHISTHYAGNMATISTALLDEDDMERILGIALANFEMKKKLAAAGYGEKDVKLLNYIVPMEWILADLPLEEIPKWVHGHHQPAAQNPNEFKILFTRAKLSSPATTHGDEIIKKTFGREPIIVVKVNKASGQVLALETPPQHVLWGDIPTPLF